MKGWLIIMKWNKRFDYPSSTRSLVMGQRHYDIDNEKLPSVTTILQQTQSEEKKSKLAEWKRKVGKIRQTASGTKRQIEGQSCTG